jgi:hypothetical protein
VTSKRPVNLEKWMRSPTTVCPVLRPLLGCLPGQVAPHSSAPVPCSALCPSGRPAAGKLEVGSDW